MEVELKGGTAAENGASDGSELTASCVDTLALRLWESVESTGTDVEVRYHVGTIRSAWGEVPMSIEVRTKTAVVYFVQDRNENVWMLTFSSPSASGYAFLVGVGEQPSWLLSRGLATLLPSDEMQRFGVMDEWTRH